MPAPIALKWVDGGRFGPVRLYTSGGRGGGLAMLVSGSQGWDSNTESLAKRLAGEGRAVLGVDLRSYLSALAKDNGSCSWVNTDFESLSRTTERDLAFSEFRAPVIVGVGAGAGVAYAAIGQVLPNTFAGGIGIDFTPSFDIGRRLCLPTVSDTPVRYGPIAGSTPWTFTPAPAFAAPGGGMERFIAAMPHAYRIAAQDDAAALDGGLAQLAGLRAASPIAGLPLFEVQPKAIPSGSPLPVVIIYSGDGGWRDIDRQLGAYLADKGFFVVGVDSLRYFWHQRTPEQMASDLTQIIQHYSDRGRGVILAGYSFGADILPFAVNRLPSDIKHQIKLISLLGISRHASFQIRISDILGAQNTDGPPTLPELFRIEGIPVVCVYGAAESDTLCTDKALDRTVTRFETHGGHHFAGDYRDVADVIAAAGPGRR